MSSLQLQATQPSLSTRGTLLIAAGLYGHHHGLDISSRKFRLMTHSGLLYEGFGLCLDGILPDTRSRKL